MILLFLIIFEVGLYWINPDAAAKSWKNSYEFSLQIVSILPPLVVIIGLFDAWLPKSVIEANLGRQSGIKGLLIAMLIGSLAAGPLFSAFPIADSLLKKGSRIANVVVFLGSWATIKLPMIMLESQFLGFRFSICRTLITIPFIFIVGLSMERLLSRARSSFKTQLLP